MARVLLLIALLLFFALGGTIGYFNAQPVRFSYIVGTIELPLIALLVSEFLLAVVVTLLVVAGRTLTLKAEIRRLKRQLQKGEAELANLRQVAAEHPPAPAPGSLPASQ
jgi:lipopolysaccharide assembly protein A